MTTVEQLQDQIRKEDIEPFYAKVYDEDLPDSVIDQFRVAIMMLPPTAHKYSMRDVALLIQRRPDEVTIRELGMIINVIFAVPWQSMYESPEEGIEKTLVFERIKDDYAKRLAAFERKCDAKMQRLMKLGGITHSAPMTNGMKIITPNQ